MRREEPKDKIGIDKCELHQTVAGNKIAQRNNSGVIPELQQLIVLLAAAAAPALALPCCRRCCAATSIHTTMLHKQTYRPIIR